MHIIFWLEKPDSKRPLRRPKSRLEDNIRVDLREIRRGSVDCMHLAQDRTSGGIL